MGYHHVVDIRGHSRRFDNLMRDLIKWFKDRVIWIRWTWRFGGEDNPMASKKKVGRKTNRKEVR